MSTHVVLGAYLLGAVVGALGMGTVMVIVLCRVLDRIDHATPQRRRMPLPAELPTQHMARVGTVHDLPRRKVWTA